MRRVCMILLVAALSASGTTPLVHAGVTERGFEPERATPKQIRQARPLEPLLAGLSKAEPPLCRGVVSEKRIKAPETAGSESISISPASTEFSNPEPGASYSHCLVVHNRSAEEGRFYLTTIEITGSPDPARQQETIERPTGLGAWIHPEVLDFTLAAGERVYLPFVITLPDMIPSGDLTAGIRVTRGLDDTEGRAALVQAAVVHRIFLTQPGGEAKPLRISRVRAPRILSHDTDPTVYRAKFVVNNAGTLLDTYDARLDVRGLGRRVGGAKAGSATILPNSANPASLAWNDVPWIGIFRPVVTVRGRGGDTTVELPLLLVLPSRPYVIAFGVAVLLPMLVFLRRWRQRRQEWMRYLEEDEGPDGDDPYAMEEWR